MTIANASVTAGKVFTADALDETDITYDDLNLLGVPTVTLNLGGVVDTADLVEDAVGATQLANAVADQLLSATATVSDEATDVVTVTVQILDAKAENLADQCVVEFWLSDTAGAVLTSTPPSGATAATTGAIIASHTAKTHIVAITNASGTLVLTFTEAGALVRYFNLIVNNLYIPGSQAMTWA